MTLLGKRARDESPPDFKPPSFGPFWKPYSNDIVNQWLSNVQIVDETSHDACPQKSWFKFQSRQTFVHHAQHESLSEKIISKLADGVRKPPPRKKRKLKEGAVEKVAKIPAGKCRKVRIYPSSDQIKPLKGWFGTARWTYNKCLDAIENESVKRDKKILRAKFLNKDAFTEDFKWVLETPCTVRDGAIIDLLNAYNSTFARGDHNFKMKFRSKKDKSQSIQLVAQNLNLKRGMFGFIKDAIPPHERPTKFIYDCRLIMTRLGQFYLCIPIALENRQENKLSADRVVALDPGVRTFQTCFDDSGLMIEVGAGDIGRINKLCLHYDDLQSRCTQVNHKRRYRMRKAGLRIQQKIRNLVDEVHKKLVKWLLDNYSVILLPQFETSRMIKHVNRKISNKTARSMMTWSHFRFRQRLLFKVKEYPLHRVVIVTEEYTSKTCGRCGCQHQKLGSNKTFECPSCRFKIDRDVNGARNILIKYLTENKKKMGL